MAVMMEDGTITKARARFFYFIWINLVSHSRTYPKSLNLALPCVTIITWARFLGEVIPSLHQRISPTDCVLCSKDVSYYFDTADLDVMSLAAMANSRSSTGIDKSPIPADDHV